MWTVIESNLGIIVACMPALRRPIRTFFPTLLGKMGNTTARRSGKHTNGNSSHATYPLDVELPAKKRNEQWLDEDKLGLAYTPRNNGKDFTKHSEAHEGEDMGNVSDGYEGSDDHILRNSTSFSQKHGRNDITRTTEFMVETETKVANIPRNPLYYPG